MGKVSLANVKKIFLFILFFMSLKHSRAGQVECLTKGKRREIPKYLNTGIHNTNWEIRTEEDIIVDVVYFTQYSPRKCDNRG